MKVLSRGGMACFLPFPSLLFPWSSIQEKSFRTQNGDENLVRTCSVLRMVLAISIGMLCEREGLRTPWPLMWVHSSSFSIQLVLSAIMTGY